MALADRITAKPPERRYGMPCSVGALLDKLPAEEVAALEHMLTAGWSMRDIYEAVTAEGHDVGMQTINRHRSRSCRCFK
jgi:hypothetical protein